jgi:flagellar motor switch protein FliM
MGQKRRVIFFLIHFSEDLESEMTENSEDVEKIEKKTILQKIIHSPKDIEKEIQKIIKDPTNEIKSIEKGFINKIKNKKPIESHVKKQIEYKSWDGTFQSSNYKKLKNWKLKSLKIVFLILNKF